MQQTATAEGIKSQLARLGVGAKAKATIRLNSGAKLKGYIAQAGDDDFVLRDRKTDAPTTIRYADVAKVDSNGGHSMTRNVAIGVAVGVGAVIATLAIIFASLND
jgi:preprotein translocase subunit SecF